MIIVKYPTIQITVKKNIFTEIIMHLVYGSSPV